MNAVTFRTNASLNIELVMGDSFTSEKFFEKLMLCRNVLDKHYDVVKIYLNSK